MSQQFFNLIFFIFGGWKWELDAAGSAGRVDLFIRHLLISVCVVLLFSMFCEGRPLLLFWDLIICLLLMFAISWIGFGFWLGLAWDWELGGHWRGERTLEIGHWTRRTFYNFYFLLFTSQRNKAPPPRTSQATHTHTTNIYCFYLILNLSIIYVGGKLED